MNQWIQIQESRLTKQEKNHIVKSTDKHEMENRWTTASWTRSDAERANKVK
jgi:hypothetical protein